MTETSDSQEITTADVEEVPRVGVLGPEVSHCHDIDRTDVHRVDVVCPQCSTPQAIAVPDNHDGTRIRWSCRNSPRCDYEGFTEGPSPADLLVSASVTPEEWEAVQAGRLAVIRTAETGAGRTSGNLASGPST